MATWSALAAARDEPKTPDADAPEHAAAAARTYTPYRRVPSYFGKVGLSGQQKEDIYVIRGRYRAEIAELERRVEELSRQEMEACRSVLTDAQRKLLDQISRVSKSPAGGSGG